MTIGPSAYENEHQTTFHGTRSPHIRRVSEVIHAINAKNTRPRMYQEASTAHAPPMDSHTAMRNAEPPERVLPEPHIGESSVSRTNPTALGIATTESTDTAYHVAFRATTSPRSASPIRDGRVMPSRTVAKNRRTTPPFSGSSHATRCNSTASSGTPGAARKIMESISHGA